MNPGVVHLQQLPGNAMVTGESEAALKEIPYGSLGKEGKVWERAGSHKELRLENYRVTCGSSPRLHFWHLFTLELFLAGLTWSPLPYPQDAPFSVTINY